MEAEAKPAAPRRRGGKAYLGASMAVQFCALARYTVLARLLGPEQLGIAVALILTTQFFQFITESGGDRFLIQDRDGDAPQAQRLVHSVWAIRGLFVAAALVLLAGPIASFFDTPELERGLMLLALSPLISGFVHFDYRRVQRDNDFRGESSVLLASEFASLVATAVAAYLTRDFTAILYGFITRSAVIVLVSHLVAERRYGFGYSAEHVRRLSAFAWPLMFNGLLLFLGSQGDRVLIGNQVGLTILGLYSAALLLIFYPAGMLQRYLSTMHLPLVSAAARSQDQLGTAAGRLAGQTLCLTVAMSAGFALVAPTAIVLFFGPRFALPVTLVAAIGILQASRFIRLWPVTIALAEGRSGVVLTSNLIRLIAFPGAVAGAAITEDLVGILGAFILAELVALLVTVALVYRGPQLSRKVGLMRVALFAASSATVMAGAVFVERASLTGGLLLVPVALGLGFWLWRSEAGTIGEGLAMMRRGVRSS